MTSFLTPPSLPTVASLVLLDFASVPIFPNTQARNHRVSDFFLSLHPPDRDNKGCPLFFPWCPHKFVPSFPSLTMISMIGKSPVV